MRAARPETGSTVAPLHASLDEGGCREQYTRRVASAVEEAASWKTDRSDPRGKNDRRKATYRTIRRRSVTTSERVRSSDRGLEPARRPRVNDAARRRATTVRFFGTGRARRGPGTGVVEEDLRIARTGLRIGTGRDGILAVSPGSAPDPRIGRTATGVRGRRVCGCPSSALISPKGGFNRRTAAADDAATGIAAKSSTGWACFRSGSASPDQPRQVCVVVAGVAWPGEPVPDGGRERSGTWRRSAQLGGFGVSVRPRVACDGDAQPHEKKKRVGSFGRIKRNSDVPACTG
jgi:hypothetical protein